MVAAKTTKDEKAARVEERKISAAEKAVVLPVAVKAVHAGTEAAVQIVLAAAKVIISARRTEAVHTARTSKTKKMTLIQTQGGISLQDLPTTTLTDFNQHNL